jgi:2-iminoacetate synthase
MSLAKTGAIQHVCQPNALMTLKEYALDYGDDELKATVDGFIESQIEKIQRDDIKSKVIQGLSDLTDGKRDIYL